MANNTYIHAGHTRPWSGQPMRRMSVVVSPRIPLKWLATASSFSPEHR
jgi:hypothetical protein